ncbi:DUF4221 family protein [Peijinzhouia sedimentorum]
MEVISIQENLVVLDTLVIKIPDSVAALPTYLVYDLILDDDSNRFVGYNPQSHSLDIFDLANQEYIRTIPLQKQGPDEIPSIVALSLGSKDDVYLLGDNEIQLMDITNGMIIWKYNINGKRSLSDNLANYQIFTPDNQGFIFHQESKKIFAVGYHNDINSCTPEFFGKENKLVVEIDYSKGSVSEKLLNITYPKTATKSYQSFLQYPYLRTSGDGILISFPFSESVYLFNLADRSYQSLLETNNEQNGIPFADCQSPEAQFEHLFNSIHFGSVLSLNSHKLYVRPVWTPKQGEPGSFNKLFRIYNSTFSSSKEIEGNWDFMPQAVQSDGEHIYMPMLDNAKGIINEDSFYLIKLGII